MVSVLSGVLASSYCYSDTSYGVTGNAANNGLQWNMGTVLPDSTDPWITVDINGLSYQYTMEKDPNADAKVYVRNEDAVNGGYVFEETDDWSGVPGGNIRRYFRFGYIGSERWGDGSIDVEGDGQVKNPVVVYNYRLDIDETKMLCAAGPLADPSCPGFAEALAAYLKNLDTEPDVNDPFYDEWVQANLADEVDVKDVADEDIEKDSEPEEEDLENRLGGENSIDKIIDAGVQADMLVALARVQTIEPYYNIVIPGGVYEETVVLKDATLPDNRRALRNLASDETHRSMVRSQYDRK